MSLKFTRVVSQINKHLFADRIEILADKGVKIAVTSELKALSGMIKAQKAEIGSDMTNPFELLGLKTDNKCDILSYKTIKSGFRLRALRRKTCPWTQKPKRKKPTTALRERIFSKATARKLPM